jgi:hypothetical protein
LLAVFLKRPCGNLGGLLSIWFAGEPRYRTQP